MHDSKKIIGLSLFSNVGIAETRFSEIGVDIKVANEIDPKRAKFYSEIHPKTNMICGDITNATVMTKIIQASKNAKVNFVIATPPCQGMSEAGKRNIFDERNQLISYSIDVIKALEPRYILIENVPTLLKTKIIINNKIFSIPEYVHNELGEKYKINKDTLLRAMDIGLPQMRKRHIYLMTRKDLNLEWHFPKKDRQVNLREAIGDLPCIDPILREGYDFTLQKFPNFEKKLQKGQEVSKWHRPPVHSWKQVEWMLNTPSGKSAIYNKVFFPKKNDGSRIKAHHNNYRRMHWDKPSRTITQNNGVISSLCCVHPGRPHKSGGTIVYSDPRVFTIYEIMIVSSIPENWNIPLWANETFIRKVIGEGIPPLMVNKVMLELLKYLEH
jgi:DNA (cytosine-5)-methyltransferase 1